MDAGLAVAMKSLRATGTAFPLREFPPTTNGLCPTWSAWRFYCDAYSSSSDGLKSSIA